MSALFTPLEVAAWSGLIAAQSHLFRQIEAELSARFGISHAEFEVLLRLFRRPDGRARIQDLAAQSLLSTSGTSRLVERLVRAGHLRRENAAEDGRGAYAVLTEEGRVFFRGVAEAHVAQVRELYLSRFTEAEQRQLADFWQRLTPG